MDGLTGISEELSRRQSWLQAILDSAAELSLLTRAVRTASNSTQSITELLWNSDPGNKNGTEVEACKRAVANLLTRVNTVLDLANIESGQFQLEKRDFNLKSLLDQVLASLAFRAHAKKLALKLTIQADIPRTLNGDALRLQQILAHLLHKAIDSTDTGEITLTAEAVLPSPCCLRFAITGSGFVAGNLDPESAFSKIVSHQMGGQVSWHNKPDGESSFIFDAIFEPGVQPESQPSYPHNLLNREKVERPAPSKSSQPLPQIPLIKLLIADDSEDCRFLLQEFLKNGPYSITFAENGKEAVEAAKSKPFDLILMDIQMPVMDGLTATRQIREAEQQEGRLRTPLLALTANARKADIELSLAAGCNAHVLKPISKIGLLHAIQKYSPAHATPEKPSRETDIRAGLVALAQRHLTSGQNVVPELLHLFEPKDLDFSNV